MDRALFIAATGARELMRRQDVQTNNLSNAMTPGFRAEVAAQRTAPVIGGAGLPTRAYAVESTPGADLAPGAMIATGRTLDVAVQGEGWFVVRSNDGTEAFTRSGSFQQSADGALVDNAGRPVIGSNNQPVVLPINSRVEINEDGSISSIPNDDRIQAAIVGDLKLVNPPAASVTRGGDGLFRLTAGGVAPNVDGVRVAGGMLEGSNVNSVETMVTMISAARHFDMQVQMMQKTDQNQQAATQILSLS
jgi:flagellar basal-body rod protein FlgF